MDRVAGIASTLDPPLGCSGGSPRASVMMALEHHPVVWLSSIRPDGRPHLLPLWFHWDGVSILIFSKPHAQKVRNLRADPRVMVAIGDTGQDFDVELIEAKAEILSVLTESVVPDAFLAKYAAQMSLSGLSRKRFSEVYAQPIRIRPTRYLEWGGPGWGARPAVAIG
ncbi:MAG: pyridoxamine 5'-phosphate oxidase family protein [Chloroflexota bacterium]|nr:pyridoxamine 5'-phosphate oxidase family protein [Chloroflexota bacterium]